MGFDNEKFMSTSFSRREAEVSVPDLKAFFKKNDKPVWTVHCLTGIELARANEAAEVNKNLKAIIEGILSRQGKKQIDAIKQISGVSDNVPQDIAKRIEMLVVGSVNPPGRVVAAATGVDVVVDYPLASRLCEYFAIEFYEITNKISELTGQGHVLGKASPSGKTRKSGTR